MNPNIGKQASKGGEAKQAKRVATLATLVDELPPLDTPANAQRSLELIRNMALSGLLAGGAAGAAVRSVEVWLKVEAHALDLHRIKELEAQVTALEEALRKARASALRVS